MYFVLPINKREKPRFDAYAEGILFDERNELAINYFVDGISAATKAKKEYKIEVDLQFSEIGKIRDRLVTVVHGTPVIVTSLIAKNFIINNYQNHAEFFPVDFDNINNAPLNNYFICNLIKKYDCTDYEKSILDHNYYTEKNEGYGGIYTIDNLIIDESKIPKDAHIFLLGNINTPIIIVSQEFKKQIEKNNITGFKFINPEDFMI